MALVVKQEPHDDRNDDEAEDAVPKLTFAWSRMPWTAQEPDQLSVGKDGKDEPLKVLDDRSRNGYWLVENEEGETGYVPYSHLEIVIDYGDDFDVDGDDDDDGTDTDDAGEEEGEGKGEEKEETEQAKEEVNAAADHSYAQPPEALSQPIGENASASVAPLEPITTGPLQPSSSSSSSPGDCKDMTEDEFRRLVNFVETSPPGSSKSGDTITFPCETPNTRNSRKHKVDDLAEAEEAMIAAAVKQSQLEVAHKRFCPDIEDSVENVTQNEIRDEVEAPKEPVGDEGQSLLDTNMIEKLVEQILPRIRREVAVELREEMREESLTLQAELIDIKTRHSKLQEELNELKSQQHSRISIDKAVQSDELPTSSRNSGTEPQPQPQLVPLLQLQPVEWEEKLHELTAAFNQLFKSQEQHNEHVEKVLQIERLIRINKSSKSTRKSVDFDNKQSILKKAPEPDVTLELEQQLSTHLAVLDERTAEILRRARESERSNVISLVGEFVSMIRAPTGTVPIEHQTSKRASEPREAPQRSRPRTRTTSTALPEPDTRPSRPMTRSRSAHKTNGRRDRSEHSPSPANVITTRSRGRSRRRSDVDTIVIAAEELTTSMPGRETRSKTNARSQQKKK